MPRLHIAPVMVVCVIALAAIVVNSQVYRYAGRPAEVRGVVGYIDDNGQKLIVIVGELEEKQWRSFDVLEETKIVYMDPDTGDKDVIGLEEIAPGDDVRLIFKERDGKYLAKRIWVSPREHSTISAW